jgi:hypothetical protein
MILRFRIGVSGFWVRDFYLCFTITTNGEAGILQVVEEFFILGGLRPVFPALAQRRVRRNLDSCALLAAGRVCQALRRTSDSE